MTATEGTPAPAGPDSGDPQTGSLTTAISVRVDDDITAVLKAIQHERGPDATLAGVARDAIRKYVAEWLKTQEQRPAR
jgi:hypothetical protein